MVRVLVRILIALLVVVVLVVGGVLASGWDAANHRPNRPARPLVVAPDSSLLVRGEHLARISCAGCHGSNHDLPLSGGTENYFDIPGGPKFGVQYAPNLTPGGRLAVYTNEELARAIREGINHEGRGLLVMPAAQFHGLSDRDLAALITYLRSQPPVDHVVPTRRINFMGYVVLGLHLFPNSVQPPVAAAVAGVAEDTTAAYGGYLIGALGCRDCHGPDLRGGRKGQFPPLGPDLGVFASAHPPELLERALTTGVGSAGQPLNPTMMPWQTFQHLDHLEILAVYAYLKSLGA